ncbi:MAG TPA: hypothetical protein VFF31_27880 [Blastocatellia bacterium]|nr:hypothetical protein [Blastocatellia bacterium]
MVLDYPFFRLLDSSLSGLVPREPVEILGDWSTKTRKTYQSEKQRGTGVGPFVEIEDRRWHGTLSCRTTATGIMFLVTTNKVYWAKAPTVALTLSVDVSLHGYAGCASDRATFTAGMGGAGLPGVPVAAPVKLDDVCVPGAIPFSAGRVVTLARTDSAAFVAVVLPSIVLKMGRNHLWRFRDDVASSLPTDIRKLLTRRRSGDFDLNTTMGTS